MSENIQNNKDDELNTSNIFDEFDVEQEDLKIDSIKKDVIYYISIFGKIFKYINFFLLFILIIGITYIYIQKSSSEFFDNKDYLNPLCDILSGKHEILEDNCSSITLLNKKIDKKSEEIEKNEFKAIVEALKDNYEIYNITNSRKILFLLEKARLKNDPLQIISEFDLLKNKFSGIETSKIQCDDINIEENILSLKCSAFSRRWEQKIPGFKGELSVNTLNGSSRSIAISFMNYIEKSEKFNLIDKQKVFSIEPYFGEGAYVYKTDFKLKMKYNFDKKLY